MNETTQSFNPIQFQGTVWSVGGLIYREVSRTNPKPAESASVVLCSGYAWPIGMYFAGTTLEYPINQLTFIAPP